MYFEPARALDDAESVKKAIASLQRTESYKLILAIAYEGFAKHNSIPWQRPFYRQCQKLPFIPYESELDALISGVGKKTATLFQLLKETAMRFGEAWQLKWMDIDLKNNLVTCNTPEKNSRPLFKISCNLSGMINQLKRRNDYIFGETNIVSVKHGLWKQCKRIAEKLQNPRIRKITYHTFRHWKATQLYHETKDVLYVMKFLGHKDVKNTLLHIDLDTAYYPSKNDSYTSRIARTEKEACDLIDSGFEYVCDFSESKIFRKRK